MKKWWQPCKKLATQRDCNLQQWLRTARIPASVSFMAHLAQYGIVMHCHNQFSTVANGNQMRTQWLCLEQDNMRKDCAGFTLHPGLPAEEIFWRSPRCLCLPHLCLTLVGQRRSWPSCTIPHNLMRSSTVNAQVFLQHWRTSWKNNFVLLQEKQHISKWQSQLPKQRTRMRLWHACAISYSDRTQSLITCKKKICTVASSRLTQKHIQTM